jgi:prevent-host-death family protein
MMVKAKDFRNNLGEYLNKAKAGTPTQITKQGQHIATLVSAIYRSPLLLPLAARVAFGAHTFNGQDASLERFDQLQIKMGKSLDIIHQFANWSWPWDWANHVLDFAALNGSALLLTWQPRNVDLQSILSGSKNAYIDSWAKGIKASKRPVYLRPFPEMNLKNTDITWGQVEPQLLIQAWRFLVNRFRRLNVNNVFWVWSPNCTDDGPHRLEDYYPGSDVVDILAVDGYNFGDGQEQVWRSFEQTFEEPYSRIVILDLHKPFWITETACAETGDQRKALWIKEMFASTKFPNLKAIVWFDEHKERDWRISSSVQTLAAFKQDMTVLV